MPPTTRPGARPEAGSALDVRTAPASIPVFWARDWFAWWAVGGPGMEI